MGHVNNKDQGKGSHRERSKKLLQNLADQIHKLITAMFDVSTLQN